MSEKHCLLRISANSCGCELGDDLSKEKLKEEEILRVLGRVWFMALVLKTSYFNKIREFKSHSARFNLSLLRLRERLRKGEI